MVHQAAAGHRGVRPRGALPPRVSAARSLAVPPSGNETQLALRTTLGEEKHANANTPWQVVGQLLQNAFPAASHTVLVTWRLKRLSSLALLLIIWQTYDSAFATGAFATLPPSNIVFIIFLSIALYAVWTIICVALSLLWLGKKDTIAVAYCVPAKTPAMGVPLANVMFAGLAEIDVSKIQIPMVVFQGFQIAAGSLLTIAFRRWVRADEEREKGRERGGAEAAAAAAAAAENPAL